MNRVFLISAGFIVFLGSAPPALAQPRDGAVFDVQGNQVSEPSILLVSGRNYGGHSSNGYRGGHSRSHGYRKHGGHRGGHSRSHEYRNHGGYRGGHSYNYGYRNHGGLHLYNFYNPYYMPFGNLYSGGYPYQRWGSYNRYNRGLAYGPYLCLEH